MSAHLAASLIRGGLVIILAVNIGVMASVCRRYAGLWVRSRGQRRLKPGHVAGVSACVLGLEATLAWGQIEALGLPGRLTDVAALTRTALYIVFAIGIAASIWSVRRWLQRAGQPDGPPKDVG